MTDYSVVSLSELLSGMPEEDVLKILSTGTSVIFLEQRGQDTYKYV